jgi:diguanylate cyclase (GGDEF)-like protein
MRFDIHTLAIAMGLATAFCAAARILLWRLHPAMPGLAYWAWASILGAVALILIPTRGLIPEMLSLTQILMEAGFVLTWNGFRRFVGWPRLSRPVLGAVAMGVLVPIAISHVEGSPVVQQAAFALLVFLISALIARALLRATASSLVTMRATGWIYVVNALFFVVRAVAVVQDALAIGPSRMEETFALALLWWLGMTIGVTLGMVLMTSERLQKDLDRQANHDPLTGALNRRAFTFMAERNVAQARRHAQPVSVLMMDLDHFKQINDTLGHAGGDAMLRLFVVVAAKVLRIEDLFCRFGGEEFVALLSGTSAVRASIVAERLRVAFAAEAMTSLGSTRSLPLAVTVSVGIAELQRDEDLEAVLRRADTALYRAKTAGRNRSELADIHRP